MFHNTTGRYWGLVPLLGYDQTLGLWWWQSDGTYYISAAPGIPITVRSGDNCNPSGLLFNGQHYYTVSGGYLWHDGSQWVISSALGCNTEEYSETVDNVTTWYGDAWWSCSTLAGTYTARGSGYINGTAKAVALGKVVGWKSTSQAGVYTPEDGSGVTGNKYAGWIKLTDNNYLTFFEQDTLHNGNPWYLSTSKSIWFDGVNWILSSAKGVKDYTEPPVYTPWISGQLYAVGSRVSYDGKFYRCWRDLSIYPSIYLVNLDWGWDEITHDYSSYIGYWSCATKTGTYSLVWPYVPPTPAPPYFRPSPETRVVSGLQYSLTGADGKVKQTSQLMAQVAQWLA